jgi:phage gp36-like protein
MPYCTQENILDRIDEATLIALTDEAGAGVVDGDKVAAAIADADATVDAYCQGRYTIPLSPVPPKITQLSVDIALYNLYSQSDLGMPEVRKDRHAEAIRFSEKVAAGTINLGSSTPAQANTDNAANIDSNARIFTREKMSGF